MMELIHETITTQHDHIEDITIDKFHDSEDEYVDDVVYKLFSNGKTPNNKMEGAFAPSMKLVAGVGFEPTTSGL